MIALPVVWALCWIAVKQRDEVYDGNLRVVACAKALAVLLSVIVLYCALVHMRILRSHWPFPCKELGGVGCAGEGRLASDVVPPFVKLTEL